MSDEFEEVSGKFADRYMHVKELAEPMIGVYLRSGQFGKFGGYTYAFEMSDGTSLGINAAGNLNWLMSKVEVGQKVKITYVGMQKIEKGEWKGQDAHTSKLQISKDTPKGVAPAAGGERVDANEIPF